LAVGLVLLCGLCGLAILLAAGGAFLLRPETGTAEPPRIAGVTAGPPVTPAPTVTSAPRSEDEASILRDDFSDPGSGWARLEEEGSIMDYDGGGYRILVNQPETTYWTVAGLEFADVSLEVDAEKIAGADDNYFGLICRYRDEDNFYIFLVSSDGYFSIGKFKGGEYLVIDEEAGQGYSQSIHQGTTTNRLRADCTGPTLSLFANGTRLATVEDQDFPSGDVGLAATAFQIAGTNILFDNFVAQEP
jgi:hypothetical protein